MSSLREDLHMVDYVKEYEEILEYVEKLKKDYEILTRILERCKEGDRIG